MAAAQAPVLNPRFLEFNASADHSTNAPTGEPLVTRYDLEFYNIGAPSPFQTNSLNKPAPNGSGVIRIDLATTFAALPTGTTFEARVVAVGPGGIGRSGLSNQFAFTNPCAVTITPTSTSAGAAAEYRERGRIDRCGVCLDCDEQCRLGHNLERRVRIREWHS